MNLFVTRFQARQGQLRRVIDRIARNSPAPLVQGVIVLSTWRGLVQEWKTDFRTDKVDVEGGSREEVDELFPYPRWEGGFCSCAKEENTEGWTGAGVDG